MPHPLERDFNHVLTHTHDLWPRLRGARLFITGGTGFVGTWLLESFAWAVDCTGIEATATVLTRDPNAFRKKSPYAASHRAIEWVEGSVQSFVFPRGEFPFVIHAATDQTSPTREEPAGTFDRELNGTRRVLDFVRRAGTQRLLFTSSGAVYGRQPSDLLNVSEDYPGAPLPVEANSAFGEAKRASEFLCAAYARQFGFAAVIARLFAFAGPYLPLDINFAIGNFIRDVLNGDTIRISGDGTPYRSYLYAADLAIWLWHLLLRGESAYPYNVGSPEPISIADLARLISDTVSPSTRVEIAGTRSPGARPSRYVPCVERAERELGLRVLVRLHEQVRRMYDWNRQFSMK